MANDKWRFYKTSSGKWWWQRKSPNGRIIGGSTESYSRKIDCVANAKRNGYAK